ncbi:class I SAM-dependent methyltransferase [Clostridium manihotivorum]|uniref:Class I SAM-dependent methyltransferase n=1 Tax=Clostridium manihotivorum TaxID=2320868 RepID=A0A410DTN0_9CLOT|nr:class I SAM-dependent methyltransferase [Clostridium manihotivorum]QAA32446.1 class I SAM-dependent methyltransferase [Clostridium manihotivorum]
MTNKFKISEEWKEYNQYVTSEYGFNQISISTFIINMKNQLLKCGYKTILDLGCGSGRHSIYFNNEGFEVYASDINCHNIDKHVKELNITNINICEHSFIDIPYDDDFFDAVICTSTIHHARMYEIKRAISEVYRVLKPQGYFIFDILSDKDASYGVGMEIEHNTFIGSRQGEEDVPHHYTSERELKSLLDLFSNIKVDKSIYKLTDLSGNIYDSKAFEVVAIK